MGGSNSSRHVSLETGDDEGIVLVKGIRLTDKVVDRMKETPPVQDPQPKSSTYADLTQPGTPQNETLTPTEHSTIKPSHPPSFANELVPPPPLQASIKPLVSKSAPDALPSVQKHVSTATNSEPLTIPISPLTVTEPVAVPLPAKMVPVVLSPPVGAVDKSAPPTITETVTSTPPPTELKTKPIESPKIALTKDVHAAPPVKVIHQLSTDETIDIPEELSFPSIPTQTSVATNPVEQAKLPITPTAELLAKIELPPSFDRKLPTSIESMKMTKNVATSRNLKEFLSSPPSSTAPIRCEDFSMKQVCPPTEDTPPIRSVVEPTNTPVLASPSETLAPLTFPQRVVNEEHLRHLIREELEKHLQDKKKMAELVKIHQQLEEEKAKADAKAKAQQQMQAEVEKLLKKEQLALQQTLKDVIIQERKNIQDEQLLCQFYWMETNKQIQKLEKKERDLVKQDLMYKEQLAKLEEKSAESTRVTSESFRKGVEETHKRFKRCQIKPVCSDLQSEILKCYLQNSGKSLTCSSIALQYVKCVNNITQNRKLSTGE